ncbi:MAG: hypothetical protein JO125_04665 [Chloroflexi bacterium]|nr:hypothetical protein [Ktedonobacteraceae bacterium]MBV9021684.1 hypothetical protein [Ktedonobacteraceae bacterium]MBV9706680.1 hypothetical protein [Chloroflexota bacterium]
MKELFNGIELNDTELAMVVGGADTATTNTASAAQNNSKTVVDDSSSNDGWPALSNMSRVMDSIDSRADSGELHVTSSSKYTTSSTSSLPNVGSLLNSL